MILYIILFMIIRSAICKQISHKSLQCYHCGSETDTGLDFPCEEFTPGFLFEGSCFKDSYCVKTITRNAEIKIKDL
ncbi:uncharacterized protein LOC142323341 isoform X2 [Lycorma delicatula]|uniref:uncharacterized protein LOC142323341 isoform X2 n=1 Tax=Lycorma delicatula TaxID=130591 RepID=UPI003F510182